jgi:acetyl esterase/lipase
MIDRRTLVGAGVVTGLAARAAAQMPPPVRGGALPAGLPQPTETIDLWPNGAPGMPAAPLVETVNERSTDPQLTDRVVFGISRPRMVVFRPDVPNGAAVLITPGGGYRWVVIDKEGYELGRWLSARGFTVFVLFYRLPGEGWAAGPDVALSDAQRAMRLIRQRASKYGVDAERICAMGFSAGGHVCTDLVARFAIRTYAAVDAADALSPRPFCAAPIYPVVSMDRRNAHPGSRKLLIADSDALEAAHSPQLNIAANSPPCFLIHAEDDDTVPVANTLLFRDALKGKGIPVETHLFAHGGHGFGLRKAIGKPVALWPELFMGWAKSVSLI